MMAPGHDVVVTAAAVTQFRALFAGVTTFYGEGRLTNELRGDGKRKVVHVTVKQPVTDARVAAHLRGDGQVLGIYPLVGETVQFAGLDIDDYRLDHQALAQRITALGLPMVVTRSTSGGAHVYVFFTEPVAAAPVRTQLTAIASWLGVAKKVEVFPKQDRLKDGEHGNYMAMPYHDAVRPMRYAYAPDGTAYPTFAAFLAGAESLRTTPAAFFALTPPALAMTGADDLLYEAPPCLQTIHAQGGLVDGTKREGMFSVLVYLRKRYPDNFGDHIDTYNQALCSGGGLKAKELVELERNSGKKSYTYKCKVPPLVHVCQRALCLRRQYGISDGQTDEHDTLLVPITHVVKYQPATPDDPPEWGITLDGGQAIRISNETFYYKDRFNTAVLAAIGRVPVRGGPAAWHAMVDQLASTADVIQLPPDAAPTGLLLAHIEQFLTASRAPTLDGVANGAVFHDTAAGVFRFQLKDLVQYLALRRQDVRPYQLYHLLKDAGGVVEVMRVRKRVRRVWSVPAALVGGGEAPEPAAGDAVAVAGAVL